MCCVGMATDFRGAHNMFLFLVDTITDKYLLKDDADKITINITFLDLKKSGS